MPAVVLFIGRIFLVVALFVFLFAIMKTGVGLVKGQRSVAAVWCIDIIDGSDQVKGIHVDIMGPVVVGRSPGADIMLPGVYVSGKHARFAPQGPALVVEDLNSRNGTIANGRTILGPTVLHDGDLVQVGDTVMRVTRQ
ncbi:MAG: FHA domain-containing protein [Coriobacteriales bacterium]|nr:FHA domain-containing protein [Coriobacteriales bacterium]